MIGYCIRHCGVSEYYYVPGHMWTVALGVSPQSCRVAVEFCSTCNWEARLGQHHELAMFLQACTFNTMLCSGHPGHNRTFLGYDVCNVYVIADCVFRLRAYGRHR